MCDGPIPVWVNVWHHFRTRESLMWTSTPPLALWKHARGIDQKLWYTCPAPFNGKIPTSYNFNEHIGGTNYEDLCGRWIMFGLTCKLCIEWKSPYSLGNKEGIFGILVASWFCYGGIRLTSQVFAFTVSGNPQRINYSLDQADCARGHRYFAQSRSCLHRWLMWASPTCHAMEKAQLGQHFQTRFDSLIQNQKATNVAGLFCNE